MIVLLTNKNIKNHKLWPEYEPCFRVRPNK